MTSEKEGFRENRSNLGEKIDAKFSRAFSLSPARPRAVVGALARELARVSKRIHTLILIVLR